MMEKKSLNQNLLTRRSDNFYIEFLGVAGNQSNILGREVIQFDMPIINFNMFEVRNKKNTQQYNSVASMDELSIIFSDDVHNNIARILYDIALDQANGINNFFEIRINFTDFDGNITETIILREVFIISISSSQLTYQYPEKCTIVSTIGYHNIDFGDPVSYVKSKFGEL